MESFLLPLFLVLLCLKSQVPHLPMINTANRNVILWKFIRDRQKKAPNDWKSLYKCVSPDFPRLSCLHPAVHKLSEGVCKADRRKQQHKQALMATHGQSNKMRGNMNIKWTFKIWPNFQLIVKDRHYCYTV